MWTFSDDPARDFEKYDADLRRNDHLYPVCEHCGERIVEGEEFVDIGGDLMHYECAGEWLFKHSKIMERRRA